MKKRKQDGEELATASKRKKQENAPLSSSVESSTAKEPEKERESKDDKERDDPYTRAFFLTPKGVVVYFPDVDQRQSDEASEQSGALSEHKKAGGNRGGAGGASAKRNKTMTKSARKMQQRETIARLRENPTLCVLSLRGGLCSQPPECVYIESLEQLRQGMEGAEDLAIDPALGLTTPQHMLVPLDQVRISSNPARIYDLGPQSASITQHQVLSLHDYAVLVRASKVVLPFSRRHWQHLLTVHGAQSNGAPGAAPASDSTAASDTPTPAPTKGSGGQAGAKARSLVDEPFVLTDGRTHFHMHQRTFTEMRQSGLYLPFFSSVEPSSTSLGSAASTPPVPPVPPLNNNQNDNKVCRVPRVKWNRAGIAEDGNTASDASTPNLTSSAPSQAPRLRWVVIAEQEKRWVSLAHLLPPNAPIYTLAQARSNEVLQQFKTLPICMYLDIDT